MSLEKWRIEAGWILCKMDRSQSSINCLQFKRGRTILNPHDRDSKTLQQYATFVKRIRQKHLLASQFPDNLTDSKGEFHKPPT
jgi:hypothetical protein